MRAGRPYFGRPLAMKHSACPARRGPPVGGRCPCSSTVVPGASPVTRWRQRAASVIRGSAECIAAAKAAASRNDLALPLRQGGERRGQRRSVLRGETLGGAAAALEHRRLDRRPPAGAIGERHCRRAPRGRSGVVCAAGCYLLVVVIAGLLLPSVNEVPKTFPAVTLYRFREASIGMQAVLWTTIGLVFAATAERVMTGRARVPRRRPAAPARSAAD